MKKICSITLLLFFSFIGRSQCNYQIAMYDTFGDGWTGAYIVVHINGSPYDTATFLTGFYQGFFFSAIDNDSISLEYIPGNWESENSYDFYVSSTLLFSDGPNPDTGFVYTTVCNSASISELDLSKSIKLERIVDITGRKTDPKPNTLLFYIYSDGTTEKVFRVE